MKLAKSHLLNSFLFFCVFNFPFLSSAQDSYQRVYLSGTDSEHTVDWDFKVSEGSKSGAWHTIPVPSNWELQGFGGYNYGHDHKNKDRTLAKEHGLYRHKFNVPAQWKGKSINIVFDGSMTDTKVKINGKSAGAMHQGAFYRFKYDISKLLKYGEENLLEVDVAKHSSNQFVNEAERQADFWIFGGIFRPVFLEVLPQQHFERIAIDARADGNFDALLYLNKHKPNTVAQVELFNVKGEKIGETIKGTFGNKNKELIISGKFQNVQSWNPEDPILYKMRFSLLQNGKSVYRKEETVGFRTVELRKNNGFYINDKKVVFKGVNRHSFWPTTGRALSEQNHIQDILLIKEMNMNAVRMSHYPPDERFLNLCDSIGLFVLDEVTGWQDSYDTIVGPKLIKETVLKDENHPSVVIWDHGNEGGWDFANEKYFHAYDIQKRPIIYPWLQRNGVDTYHYPSHKMGVNRLRNGEDVFMPTELLHGLYDGGHGAGLQDFWDSYSSSPLFAGGFLWSFSDEAVLRRDKNNVLDSDGNHGPDGIVGPYREKEGSFYTIKEIFSPIQIEPIAIDQYFDGNIFISNKYIYTNLKKCNFEWKLSAVSGFSDAEVIGSGGFQGPDIAPGERRRLEIELPEHFANAEIFTLTANDPFGKEVNTWSWALKQPEEVGKQLIKTLNAGASESQISVIEGGEEISVKVNESHFSFDKSNGKLLTVENKKKEVSFNGGPSPAGIEANPKSAKWWQDSEGNFNFRAEYDSYPNYIHWKLGENGLLYLEVAPLTLSRKEVDFIGISFNYPESKVEGVKWMGKGPYRVWKNRMKGAEMGIWEKDYNNTVTGESFDSLIYPEFKGYHANLYWMELQTSESPIRIITETPGLFFRLYTPKSPKLVSGRVSPPFPTGDISFLYEIPAIGTKFKEAEALGPGSQKGEINGHAGDAGYPIKLWFDFSGE